MQEAKTRSAKLSTVAHATRDAQFALRTLQWREDIRGPRHACANPETLHEEGRAPSFVRMLKVSCLASSKSRVSCTMSRCRPACSRPAWRACQAQQRMVSETAMHDQ
jgi:hypothetical protein